MIYGNVVGGSVSNSINQQVEYVGKFTNKLPTMVTVNGVTRLIRKGDYVVSEQDAVIDGVKYLSGDWAVYNGESWDKIMNSIKIVDNVSSEATDEVLSANQGRLLKTQIDTLNGLRGQNSGIAELDSEGKIPSSQLPSYVDDVLEYNGTSNFPSSGESGKIYVDTSANITYRWSGTQYVEISKSLGIGNTANTAAAGNHTHTELISHINDAVIHVTNDDKTLWDSKSDFSGDYNDLTNKPTIPEEYYLPTASSNILGGIKIRLDGTALYISTTESDA